MNQIKIGISKILVKKCVFNGARVLAILSYICAVQVVTTSSTIVQTTNGRVKGSVAVSREGTEYFEFLGIPYAQKPTGTLRFQPPQPPENWTHTKSTQNFGPECLQFDVVVLLRSLGSEDCLYLNVFTPKINSIRRTTDTELLPVMVFIHGGMFHSGSSNMYKGKFFMDENVVLVTMNYRVGALGFFSTDDEVVRGNMGLKDQNLALKWVRDNIMNFGGDARRVTLFGESAGAASVHYHMLSPMSKGLFHKAISQSGNGIRDYRSTKHPAVQARYLAEKFACPTKTSKEILECLQKVDGQKLINVHQEAVGSIKPEYSLYVPIVEKVRDQYTFLGEEPETLIRTGKYNKVPWIVGVNSGEGLIYTAKLMNNYDITSRLDYDWEELLPQLLQYNRNSNEAAAMRIRDFYFSDDRYPSQSIQNLTNMYTDKAFFLTTHRAARLQSQHSPVYLYYFNYKTQLSVYDILSGVSANNRVVPAEIQFATRYVLDWVKRNIFRQPKPFYGACHGDELNLQFNTQLLLEVRQNSPDYEVSKSMVKAWADFAREDKLILKFQSIRWPPVHPKDEVFKYMEINQRPSYIDEPFTQRLNFWNTLNVKDR